MKQPCPNPSDNCPHFDNGCYSDTHHLYKRNDADTQLKRLYGSLPENTVQLCRLIHEEVEAAIGWLPFPEDDVMRDTLMNAAQYISRTQRKKAGL